MCLFCVILRFSLIPRFCSRFLLTNVPFPPTRLISTAPCSVSTFPAVPFPLAQSLLANVESTLAAVADSEHLVASLNAAAHASADAHAQSQRQHASHAAAFALLPRLHDTRALLELDAAQTQHAMASAAGEEAQTMQVRVVISLLVSPSLYFFCLSIPFIEPRISPCLAHFFS